MSAAKDRFKLAADVAQMVGVGAREFQSALQRMKLLPEEKEPLTLTINSKREINIQDSKDEYEKRFKFGNYFSSFLIFDRKYKKIIGHVGFKINNLNPRIKGRIGFRHSTFIAEEYRGIGVYQYFMNYATEDLKNNFYVKFIFAWPNKINLISCLKDSKYINLNPVITWQLNLNDFSN